MTQAVNLANFANSLDSSGGMNPSALNAAVPISKGGTAATTALAARTALGLGYDTIASFMYPVGSIYINASVTNNPAALFGFGTWVAFGSGRVMVGLNASDALFDTLEETGGSKDAIVVSHTHTATVTDPGHTHQINAVNEILAGGSFSTLRPQAGGNNTTSAVTGITVTNSTVGSSGTNGNLQPYITVIMWKRTA